MKKNLLAGCVSLLFLLGMAVMTHATLIQFTATDFIDLTPNSFEKAPDKKVFGEFEYTLDSFDYFTLTAFDMTISKKDYVLSDIVIAQPFGTDSVLMGANDSALSLGLDSEGKSNDFYFQYNFLTETVNFLTYTVEKTDVRRWSATKISTTAAPVPEPATMLLFATGFVALAGSRIRRKKK